MNKNLKVLQLIDSLNPGGAEMMAVNIANGLEEIGVESHVCATRMEGLLKEKLNKNSGYLFLNRKKRFDISGIKKLYSYVKLHQIQIIHAHSSSFFIATLLKLVLPKVQLIWHDHYGKSDGLDARKSIVLKGCSLLFSSAIAVKKDLLQWGQQHLWVKQYVLFSNFADLSASKDKITFLKGDENKRIVCLANFRPQKDHLNLLEAFKRIYENHNDWTLHLVGLDLLDAYSDKIKEYIVSNSLQNRVFLYSGSTDTDWILKQSTIGVLSSHSEGLPLALLEYGLAKLPVVVTNVGDCNIVVEHEQNGLLVARKNSTALANGILFLMNNESKRVEYATELHQTIQSRFSKKAYMNQLLSIYQH